MYKFIDLFAGIGGFVLHLRNMVVNVSFHVSGTLKRK